MKQAREGPIVNDDGGRLPTEQRDALRTGVLHLAAGVYASPGAALFADVEGGAFADATDALAAHLGVAAPTLAPADRSTLQSSYVDLFVSSVRGVAAVPYVGYAADGELLGPTAQALKRFYQAHDVTPSATWHDLPDHVAAVAEAGALLQEAGRPQAAGELLTRFLLPWFQRFTAPVESRDVSGFYGPMTRFLHDAIREVTREDSTARS